MKMSAKLYDELKADCITVLASFDRTVDQVTDAASAWQVFHTIDHNRSYDDNHPGFSSGAWKRRLPCVIPPNQGRAWIDRFYRDEQLNDEHIKTALRSIFPNAVFSKR